MPDPYHPFLDELDQDMFLAYAMGTHPTEPDLDELEGRLNWKLPVEYRRLLKQFGAIHLEANEAVWPRPEQHQVGPFWTSAYAFAVLGAGSNLSEGLILEAVAAEFWYDRPELQDLLPVFRWVLSDGGSVCYDRSGRLIDWRHDDPSEREPLDVGLDDFLVSNARKLVELKNKMKAGLRN